MRTVLIWMALAGLVAGCDGVNQPIPPSVLEGPDVIVVGILLSIDDNVPSDGPVILTIRTDEGDSVTAYLPSFFTAVPPPEENWEIYQTIQTLSPGTRVAVTGHPTSNGLEITWIGSVRNTAGSAGTVSFPPN